MKKSPRLLLIPLLAAFLLSGSGCALFLVGAGAGAGAVAYAKGRLDTTEAASLDRTWIATLEAVRELDYTITETNRHATSAVLIGRSPRDDRLEVTLSSLTDKTTAVGIRVGLMGDEERSRLVLDRIRRHLRD